MAKGNRSSQQNNPLPKNAGEQKWWQKTIKAFGLEVPVMMFMGVLVGILISIAFAITSFLAAPEFILRSLFPNEPKEVACVPAVVTETLPKVSIFENSYHLGDDTRSEFSPAEPQTNPFEGTFEITQINDKIFLQMTVRDVSAQETKEPKRIYINGTFIDFLNRYVAEEKLDPTVVQIPVPKEVLHLGKNTI